MVPATGAPLRLSVATFQLAIVAGALILLAGAQVVALGGLTVGTLPTLVAGVGLLGLLALALVGPELAVGLGIALLAVVRVEPAPADAVFGIVIGLALVTGRFTLSRIPPLVVWLSGAYLVLNLFASVEVIAVGRAVQFFAISLYLVVFALWLASYLSSRQRARLVVRAYLAAAVLSALVGAAALLHPFPGSDVFVYEGARAQGLFKDPLVFAPFLVLALLILLEELVHPRLLRLHWTTKTVCIAILGAGILLSFSRAAWLNLALGIAILLGVLLLRRGGARRALAIFAVVFTAGAVALGALAATGSVSFLEQRLHLQGYDSERFGAQALGLREGERYPLGIGPGQFEVVSPVSAHSTFVRAFAEAGLPGLLALGGLFLLTLVLAARNVLHGADTYGIGSATLLAAWCGLLLNSLVVDTLHWRHLWVVAAMVWAGSMRRPAWRVRT